MKLFTQGEQDLVGLSLNDEQINTAVRDTIEQLELPATNQPKTYSPKYTKYFSQTLAKLIIAFDMGSLPFDNNTDTCNVYKTCIQYTNFVDLATLEKQTKLHVMQRSNVKPPKVLEYLINWLYQEYLQMQSPETVTQPTNQFIASVIHSLFLLQKQELEQAVDEGEITINMRGISLHLPEERSFKKDLEPIDMSKVKKFSQKLVVDNDRTICVHPLFDIITNLVTDRVRITTIRKDRQVVGVKDNEHTFVSFSTLRDELTPVINEYTNAILVSDSPLQTPVLDINSFESGTYIHTWPYSYQEMNIANPHVHRFSQLYTNAKEQIRLKQEQLLNEKNKYNNNNPVVLEVNFKRFIVGEKVVYCRADEAIVHKLCTTPIQRTLDKSSVDYNFHTAEAYENGEITENIYQVEKQTRVGELRDGRLLSGFGVFYTICPTVSNALAVINNLQLQFIGALAVFEPTVEISKRSLKVPARIAKLSPAQYEYLIPSIHEYSAKHIDEVALHVTNKVAFYLTTTPTLFTTGNVTKAQALYGISAHDMSKHPGFIIRMKENKVVSYLYYYRIRGNVLTTPWAISESMLELQQASSSSSSLKEFQQKYGKYQYCDVVYFLLSEFGPDVSTWDYEKFINKQEQLVAAGERPKYDLEFLTSISSKINKMPTLANLNEYMTVLEALPIPPQWARVIKSVFPRSLTQNTSTVGSSNTLVDFQKQYTLLDHYVENAFLPKAKDLVSNEVMNLLKEDRVAYQHQRNKWETTLQGMLLLQMYESSDCELVSDLMTEGESELDCYQLALRKYMQVPLPNFLAKQFEAKRSSTYNNTQGTWENKKSRQNDNRISNNILRQM